MKSPFDAIVEEMTTPQKITALLSDGRERTTQELAQAIGIGRRKAGKELAKLEKAGAVTRDTLPCRLTAWRRGE